MAREAAWLARQTLGDAVELTMVVDDRRYLVPATNGIAVTLLETVRPSPGSAYVIAVGDGRLRERSALACDQAGLAATTLIHPRVERSDSLQLGPGSIICAGTVLSTNVDVRSHVIVNLGCTISHDVVVEDYVTIAPGVHVSGHVKLRRGCTVGTGASIINGSAEQPLVIGEGAVVAAGACVTKPVEAGSLVAGVPAVRKK